MASSDGSAMHNNATNENEYGLAPSTSVDDADEAALQKALAQRATSDYDALQEADAKQARHLQLAEAIAAMDDEGHVASTCGTLAMAQVSTSTVDADHATLHQSVVPQHVASNRGAHQESTRANFSLTPIEIPDSGSPVQARDRAQRPVDARSTRRAPPPRPSPQRLPRPSQLATSMSAPDLAAGSPLRRTNLTSSGSPASIAGYPGRLVSPVKSWRVPPTLVTMEEKLHVARHAYGVGTRSTNSRQGGAPIPRVPASVMAPSFDCMHPPLGGWEPPRRSADLTTVPSQQLRSSPSQPALVPRWRASPKTFVLHHHRTDGLHASASTLASRSKEKAPIQRKPRRAPDRGFRPPSNASSRPLEPVVAPVDWPGYRTLPQRSASMRMRPMPKCAAESATFLRASDEMPLFPLSARHFTK